MAVYIVAQISMKAEAEGGRHREIQAGYAPHLVVPPDSTFLGVQICEIEEPDRTIHPGTTAKVLFQLMYHPRVDYSALVEGAEFNIHEGSHVVGTGRVLDRD